MATLLLRYCVFIILILSLSVASVKADQQTQAVITAPGEFVITQQELDYIAGALPLNLRTQAADDPSAKYEAISATVASKRILKSMNDLTATDDPDLYYEFMFSVLAAAKEVDARRFQKKLELPNFAKLAEERYRVSRNEIAVVAERRAISHILLLCSETCDKDQKRADLETIRLRAVSGESFSDLAAEFSQDPGSVKQGGRLRNPIEKKDDRIDAGFREGAFSLESSGDISDIVESRFGLHVIKLNEIIPERERTFDEVKQPLIEEVEARFRDDAYRDYILEMGSGDDLLIDRAAVDAAFGASDGED
jgi:peptidyl-prolyl cis-trans isomerase C